MWLFIEPVDVWLFRDGRPFSAGEDRVARSLFPPTPFTVQGAIRARVLADSGVDIEEYAKGRQSSDPMVKSVGDQIGFPGEGYGKLRLRGPFVAERKNDRIRRYYPLPADIEVIKGDDEAGTVVLAPKRDLPFITDFGDMKLHPLWCRSVAVPKETDGWLSEEEMARYLSMNTEQLRVTEYDEILDYEGRFGIAIDSATKRVVEGMLYQVDFVRLRDNKGLMVEVDGVSLRDSGVLLLGGEGRAATFKQVDQAVAEADSAARAVALREKRFKLVLTTPAYFSNGWCPSDFGQFFSGGHPRLVAAAIPRLISLGGARVDLDSQRRGNFQKPMYRFVPAGAVYFFETDDTVTLARDAFTETPDGEELDRIGFGQFLIGRWDYA